MCMYVCVGWLEETRPCRSWWGEARIWLYGWSGQKTPSAPYPSLPLTTISENSRYSKAPEHAHVSVIHGSTEISISAPELVDSAIFMASSDCIFLCSFFPVPSLLSVSQSQAKPVKPSKHTQREPNSQLSCFLTTQFCWRKYNQSDNNLSQACPLWRVETHCEKYNDRCYMAIWKNSIFFCWPSPCYFLISFYLFYHHLLIRQQIGPSSWN